jgi:hypothetical protein
MDERILEHFLSVVDGLHVSHSLRCLPSDFGNEAET